MQDKNYLAWIDLEMTGLNPDADRIIEAALVITDIDLNIIDKTESIAIHQSDELLSTMDAWNTTTHAKTGLTERVKQSQINEQQAEEILLGKLKQWLPEQSTPLCGNSVHQDRRFLVKYMPRLEAYFHYRNLDVSTLKELARRWNPSVFKNVEKKGAHQALDDIIESIEELKYYRKYFLCVAK